MLACTADTVRRPTSGGCTTDGHQYIHRTGEIHSTQCHPPAGTPPATDHTRQVVVYVVLLLAAVPVLFPVYYAFVGA